MCVQALGFVSALDLHVQYTGHILNLSGIAADSANNKILRSRMDYFSVNHQLTLPSISSYPAINNHRGQQLQLHSLNAVFNSVYKM